MTTKKLMSIGAHADDIEINTGGTLLKYRERGYEVVYVMSTNNMSGIWVTFDPDGTKVVEKPPYDAMMKRRKQEAATAAAFFGTEAIHLDHPQRHYLDMDSEKVELRYGGPRPDCVPPDTPTILTAHEDAACVERLAALILEQNPEAIMTHGPIQIDMEHVGTCLLVTKAYRKAKEAGYEGMLLHWLDNKKTIFSESFHHFDTYIDISGYQERKVTAVGLHVCQMPDLSRLTFMPWGKDCGCEHAEVFTLVGTPHEQASENDFSREIIAHLKR